MKKVELRFLNSSDSYYVRFDDCVDYKIISKDEDSHKIDIVTFESNLGVVNYVTDSEVDEKKRELLEDYIEDYCVYHDMSEDEISSYYDYDYDYHLEDREEFYQEFLSNQDSNSKWHCNSDTYWQYLSDIDNEHDFLMSIIDILAPCQKKTELLKEIGYKIVELTYFPIGDFGLVAKFDDHDDIDFKSDFDRFLSVARQIKSYSDYYDFDGSSLTFNNPAKVYFFVKDTTHIRKFLLSMQGNYFMLDKLAEK